MTEHYDVVIVGAGPAGLAAAEAALAHGARVAWLDAQATAGGQVWRRDVEHGWPPRAQRVIEYVTQHANATWMPQTQVVTAEASELLLQNESRAWRISYDALVLATGARELLLPFPGWTLPGVTGAGGLQALAKQGWPLAGRRVVIAGSGPLLLAVAATAKRHGAHVLGIYEQASAATVHNFAQKLWRWPGKALQAVSLRARLAGIPYRCGSIVTRALGDSTLQLIEVDGPRGVERFECDQLAVGYGLVPNVELAHALGCAMKYEGAHPCIEVDAMQCTSVPHIYAAGEVCGIGGHDCAWLEGRIAGLAATNASIGASLLRKQHHARTFAAALREYFALDPYIHDLSEPDTLICRCEDVPLRALEDYDDARNAKLATRCGMGACQGRVCGTALAELGRFPRSGLRPPLFPTRLATLGELHSSCSQGSIP
ncbi:FAD-dependent oxidoreductase [Dyella acidisoli]|uniref:Oxidoreductase n=1 Tax=Dyella acidisoli TaxID=1867834 RepID=A0ABQ5XNH3_9GAMM|nr:FAD-dependent oxidoreductase [Dyella acidisoli]GLQ93250.1 oxidoreductase [Dyella acidisoli]